VDWKAQQNKGNYCRETIGLLRIFKQSSRVRVMLFQPFSSMNTILSISIQINCLGLVILTKDEKRGGVLKKIELPAFLINIFFYNNF
jgi:hypothetical protein